MTKSMMVLPGHPTRNTTYSVILEPIDLPIRTPYNHRGGSESALNSSVPLMTLSSDLQFAERQRLTLLLVLKWTPMYNSSRRGSRPVDLAATSRSANQALLMIKMVKTTMSSFYMQFVLLSIMSLTRRYISSFCWHEHPYAFWSTLQNSPKRRTL